MCRPCVEVSSLTETLRILITSRRERDIEDLLSTVTDYNINIKSAIVDRDIYIYVLDRLAMDSRLKKWPLAVQEEITVTLMEKAGGMCVSSVKYYAHYAYTEQVSMSILSA